MKITECLPYMGIMIVIISFMGWLLENLWLAITKGYIDNRNMRLPFLLGYGLLVTAFALCFATPDNIRIFSIVTDITGRLSWIIYFIIAFVIICAGEHILGSLVERICGVEYWNYDWVPLKISKYTTIPTSIGFALILTLFMEYGYFNIMKLIMRLNKTVTIVTSVISLVVLSVDFFKSFSLMYKERRLNEKWKITLKR